MKNILIKLILLYQKMPFRYYSSCRFQPTCSDYAIVAIREYGSIKGSYMAFKRILRCNPFNKNTGYDPVKEKR